MSEQSILNKLNKYMSTTKAKQAVKKSMSANTIANIHYYAERLKEILQDEVSIITSSTTGEAYLNYINIDNGINIVNQHGEEYLSVELYFSDEVLRESLYFEKYGFIYMPYIVNNGTKQPNNIIWGFDRHGNYVSNSFQSQYIGFMNRAIDKFNAEVEGKNIFVELNINYDGGTFGEKLY